MKSKKRIIKIIKYFVALCIVLEFFFLMFLISQEIHRKLKDFEYTCSDCNIILISVDTLRSDRLGIYGYKKITPHIDELSKNGLIYMNAYSMDHWTIPSYATLFTSKDVSLHGMNQWNLSLNPKEITLTALVKMS